MKISACVITKNEEKNIQRWMDNLRGIADEMIVVDTGSKDRTVELAQAGGASVYHFAWRNDFSAAKNFALDKARGDWIIFLDADEYFSEPTRKKLRAMLAKIHGNRKIMGISSRLYNIDADRNNAINTTAVQQRIFRNSKQLRYEGRIHEYLSHPGRKPMEFAMSDFVIYHTGYSSSLTRVKNVRNLLLLLLDIQAEGGVLPRHYSYLSVSYYNLQQYDKAVQYAKLAVEAKGEGAKSTLVKQYWIWIRSERMRQASPETLQEIVRRALEDAPGHPDFLWEGAKIALQRHDYVLAEKQMTGILALVKDGKYMLRFETTIDGQFPIIYAALGKICDIQGRSVEAVVYYRKSLEVDPYKANVLGDLLRLLFEGAPQKAMDVLDGIYGGGQERSFLLKCLAGCPRNEIYAHYMRSEKGSYEELMGRKAYLEAARKAAGDFSAFLDSGMAETDKARLELLGRNFVMALLFLSPKEFGGCERLLALLPAPLRQCVLRFHDDSAPLPIECAPTYHILLETVLQYGSPEIMDRLGLVARAFIEQDILDASVKLFERGRWQTVLDLYKDLSEKTESVLPGVWYYRGVCLFRLGRREEALECLERSERMNMQSPDLSQYIFWCREGIR